MFNSVSVLVAFWMSPIFKSENSLILVILSFTSFKSNVGFSLFGYWVVGPANSSDY